MEMAIGIRTSLGPSPRLPASANTYRNPREATTSVCFFKEILGRRVSCPFLNSRGCSNPNARLRRTATRCSTTSTAKEAASGIYFSVQHSFGQLLGGLEFVLEILDDMCVRIVVISD